MLNNVINIGRCYQLSITRNRDKEVFLKRWFYLEINATLVCTQTRQIAFWRSASRIESYAKGYQFKILRTKGKMGAQGMSNRLLHPSWSSDTSSWEGSNGLCLDCRIVKKTTGEICEDSMSGCQNAQEWLLHFFHLQNYAKLCMYFPHLVISWGIMRWKILENRIPSLSKVQGCC